MACECCEGVLVCCCPDNELNRLLYASFTNGCIATFTLRNVPPSVLLVCTTPGGSVVGSWQALGVSLGACANVDLNLICVNFSGSCSWIIQISNINGCENFVLNTLSCSPLVLQNSINTAWTQLLGNCGCGQTLLNPGLIITSNQP